MNLNLTVLFLEIIYLKKIKGDAYVINFGDYIDVGMHWISLFCRKSEIVFFDSFGVEHVPEDIY